MANPASFLNVLNGTETTQNLLLAAGCTLGGRPIGGGGAGVVNTTASLLSITATTHAGKIVTISSATPIAITLPAATGTGDKYEFFVAVAATATTSTISTVATGEVMSGVVFTAITTSNNAIGFTATTTDNTISLNGSTKGGVKGDRIVLIDVAASLWAVTMFTTATGSTATPFSHV